MARVSRKVSQSLSEYLVLAGGGWVKSSPENVSLRAELGDISLEYPYMTARMQSVVGPDMAVAAGRNGILTIVPRSLRDSDKRAIINANNRVRLKKGDFESVRNPLSATPESSIEDVVRMVDITGYSVIPVMDRFSRLLGVYVHDPEHPLPVSPNTKIKRVMHKLSEYGQNDGEVLCLKKPKNRMLEKKEISRFLEKNDVRFAPIINEHNVLERIAFLNNFDTNFIGLAISTRQGWEEEIEKWGSQVDTLCIDSSNACFRDAIKILKYAKQKFPDKPFGIGNIIQYEDFITFADAGADYIIGGMGVGSICQTGSKRGNGRGQFTVATELARARDDYHEKTGRYVYFVLDGEIDDVKNMTVALAFADFIMMGHYFNKFYEAAARKFRADKKTPTKDEKHMRYVESWGEGHPRATLVAMYGIDLEQRSSKESRLNKPIQRYGQTTLAGSTVEGVVQLIDYEGRLRPNVERDARYIRTTISNAGGSADLKSFRKRAVLERASEMTLRSMLPHGGEVIEE